MGGENEKVDTGSQVAEEAAAETAVVTDAGLTDSMMKTLTADEDVAPEVEKEAPAKKDDAEPEPELPPEEDDPEKKSEDDDAAKAEAEEHGKLAPEVQDILNRRIGKEVGKRKALSEELDASKATVTELTERVAELEAGGAQAPMVVPQGVDPLMLMTSAKQIDEQDANLEKIANWTLKNWDGYEGEDDEGNEVSYSAEQIRQRYHEVTESRTRIVPAARNLLAARQQADAQTREVYPELFDRKSDEYALLQQTVSLAPGLMKLPSAKMIIGDMIAGEKARKAAADKKTKTPEKKPPAKAPVVPAKATPSSDLGASSKTSSVKGLGALGAKGTELSDNEAVSAMEAFTT